MEEKQLDFNQPFLSVRRNSPMVNSEKEDSRKTNHSFWGIPRLPSRVPELKSGPVSNPGTVPFLWEQTPGHPKEERKHQAQNCVRPPVAPNLPPGRDPKASQHDSRKHFPSGSDEIHQRLKNGVLLDEDAKNFESGKEKAAEENSDSGDCDEAFTDALDTLSRTESFFLDCSMSGVSGFDNFDVKLKPSRSFSTDQQTREFMMDRFLPAAKAMTSEAPHYVPKKHVAHEQPQQLKKILMQDQPSLRYGPGFSKRYSHYQDDQAEESDEESNYDRHPNMPSVCGLLPRFCFKNSLCRLNPLPTMSTRPRVPESPGYKMQPSSSSSGSYSETETELRSDVSEPRAIDKVQIVELNETENRLRNDRSHLHIRKGSTYFDAPSSFLEEKENPNIAQETNNTGKDIEFRKNGCKTFGEFLADNESPKELNSESPVVEKTLYVDRVHKVESPKKIPSPYMKETLGSSLEDFNKLDPRNGEEKHLPGAHEFGDPIIEYSIDKEDLELHSTNTQDAQMEGKQATDVLEKILRKKITFEDSHQCHYEFPPLPKSPSDSWLCRTLPTAPKNTTSRRRSYLVEDTKTRNRGLKTSEGDFTAIKRHQLQCAEELLTPIPELA